MALKISVHTDMSAALAEKLAAASTAAEHAVAVRVANDTEPYVPALTKSLVNRTKVKGGYIIYPGPYAKFLYYGKLMIDPETGSSWARENATKVVTGKNLKFNTSKHSKAQAHWFEASKAQNLDKWKETARKKMMRNI